MLLELLNPLQVVVDAESGLGYLQVDIESVFTDIDANPVEYCFRSVY